MSDYFFKPVEVVAHAVSVDDALLGESPELFDRIEPGSVCGKFENLKSWFFGQDFHYLWVKVDWPVVHDDIDRFAMGVDPGDLLEILGDFAGGDFRAVPEVDISRTGVEEPCYSHDSVGRASARHPGLKPASLVKERGLAWLAVKTNFVFVEQNDSVWKGSSLF